MALKVNAASREERGSEVPAAKNWQSYLSEALIASGEFMDALDELPAQERGKAKGRVAAGNSGRPL
ncbi:MAG TPA: hypothetical protein VMD99_04110 [Terriglobales bacterium]|nr:hypothetical protein [Terriglobales bacterium]